MKTWKHADISPGMEEKGQNGRENRVCCLQGDFSAILETQILSFPEVNRKKCCTHRGKLSFRFDCRSIFSFDIFKETTDDVPGDCLYIEC